MTATGNLDEKSSTKSPVPSRARSSRCSCTSCRMESSRPATRRGVKVRDTNLRWRSWAGGSIVMIDGGKGGCSSERALTDERCPQSARAAFMSEYRERA